MNNEEKILSAIESLTSTVNTLVTDVNTLATDVKTLRTDVDALKQGQQEIQQTVSRIEVEHGKKLDALFDGFKANLDMHEAIESRIGRLESTSEKHTVEILAFRHAK